MSPSSRERKAGGPRQTKNSFDENNIPNVKILNVQGKSCKKINVYQDIQFLLQWQRRNIEIHKMIDPKINCKTFQTDN